MSRRFAALLTLAGLGCGPGPMTVRGDDAAPPGLAVIENGSVRVGIDRTKGGAITWLSWGGCPVNAVNVHDPGRLVQQSYYAGKRLDRRTDGQHRAWSPWTWNPIQAGGVGSWARVTTFERTDESLFTETIPKLWDMPNEEAAAVIRQWTGFEPGMPNVVAVRCEFDARPGPDERWGPAVPRHQELPACYFTRRFATFKSYLGAAGWRDESQPPGPPWGSTVPPRRALACFDENGQGIALFSPVTTGGWNFGPHGGGNSADPQAGPCVHIAPVATTTIGPGSVLRYRYWLVVGSAAELAGRLDDLWAAHATERLVVETAAPP